MSEAKSTPGPWQFGLEDDGPNCLVGERGMLWCRVVDAPGRSATANARLIAAAPALLAELVECEQFLAPRERILSMVFDNCPPELSDLRRRLSAVRAAINLARGA